MVLYLSVALRHARVSQQSREQLCFLNRFLLWFRSFLLVTVTRITGSPLFLAMSDARCDFMSGWAMVGWSALHDLHVGSLQAGMSHTRAKADRIAFYVTSYTCLVSLAPPIMVAATHWPVP